MLIRGQCWRAEEERDQRKTGVIPGLHPSSFTGICWAGGAGTVRAVSHITAISIYYPSCLSTEWSCSHALAPGMLNGPSVGSTDTVGGWEGSTGGRIRVFKPGDCQGTLYIFNYSSSKPCSTDSSERRIWQKLSVFIPPIIKRRYSKIIVWQIHKWLVD